MTQNRSKRTLHDHEVPAIDNSPVGSLCVSTITGWSAAGEEGGQGSAAKDLDAFRQLLRS